MTGPCDLVHDELLHVCVAVEASGIDYYEPTADLDFELPSFTS